MFNRRRLSNLNMKLLKLRMILLTDPNLLPHVVWLQLSDTYLQSFMLYDVWNNEHIDRLSTV